MPHLIANSFQIFIVAGCTALVSVPDHTTAGCFHFGFTALVALQLQPLQTRVQIMGVGELPACTTTGSKTENVAIALLIALLALAAIVDVLPAHLQVMLGLSFANSTQAACCFMLCC